MSTARPAPIETNARGKHEMASRIFVADLPEGAQVAAHIDENRNVHIDWRADEHAIWVPVRQIVETTTPPDAYRGRSVFDGAK